MAFLFLYSSFGLSYFASWYPNKIGTIFVLSVFVKKSDEIGFNEKNIDTRTGTMALLNVVCSFDIIGVKNLSNIGMRFKSNKELF